MANRECRCGARMKVRTSRTCGSTAVQYLRCTCGASARVAVPAKELWRRRRS